MGRRTVEHNKTWADLQSLKSSQVGSEVRREHSREGVHIGRADFLEDLRSMLSQEGDKVLLFKQHILLQDLDVCLGLAQLVDPAHITRNLLDWPSQPPVIEIYSHGHSHALQAVPEGVRPDQTHKQ